MMMMTERVRGRGGLSAIVSVGCFIAAGLAVAACFVCAYALLQSVAAAVFFLLAYLALAAGFFLRSLCRANHRLDGGDIDRDGYARSGMGRGACLFFSAVIPLTAAYAFKLAPWADGLADTNIGEIYAYAGAVVLLCGAVAFLSASRSFDWKKFRDSEDPDRKADVEDSTVFLVTSSCSILLSALMIVFSAVVAFGGLLWGIVSSLGVLVLTMIGVVLLVWDYYYWKHVPWSSDIGFFIAGGFDLVLLWWYWNMVFFS